ncbi:MAG TPA: AAA family ATPase [Gammaproteobacteria bacterium]|nr:AAA family ATPase [Gammaproteobacteria bacterium]
MPHVLIAGITESGKSTLARELAAEYRRADIGVLVLDPLADPRWEADYQTTDPDAFLQTAKQSWECALFLDESGETVGRYKEEMFWCATQARHRAHRSHFITQRPVQLAKTVRDQCTRLFLFAVSTSDAKVLADEWAKPALLEAATLGPGEFFDVRRFGEPRRRRVF